MRTFRVGVKAVLVLFSLLIIAGCAGFDSSMQSTHGKTHGKHKAVRQNNAHDKQSADNARKENEDRRNALLDKIYPDRKKNKSQFETKRRKSAVGISSYKNHTPEGASMLESHGIPKKPKIVSPGNDYFEIKGSVSPFDGQTVFYELYFYNLAQNQFDNTYQYSDQYSNMYVKKADIAFTVTNKTEKDICFSGTYKIYGSASSMLSISYLKFGHSPLVKSGQTIRFKKPFYSKRKSSQESFTAKIGFYSQDTGIDCSRDAW